MAGKHHIKSFISHISGEAFFKVILTLAFAIEVFSIDSLDSEGWASWNQAEPQHVEMLVPGERERAFDSAFLSPVPDSHTDPLHQTFIYPRAYHQKWATHCYSRLTGYVFRQWTQHTFNWDATASFPAFRDMVPLYEEEDAGSRLFS